VLLPTTEDHDDMLQPVELQDFFITFFSAAMVILFGALYAMLFAWGRLHGRPRLVWWGYAAYAVLVVSVFTLADATHLTGFWTWLVVAMLVGYLVAPHAIWHLCEGTHAEAGEPDGEPTQHGELSPRAGPDAAGR
jgi:hypothetical protein